MAETARQILERQEEGYRRAAASIAEGQEEMRPRVPDLPEDAGERDALLAKIDDPEGFTFRGEAEIDWLATEIIRADLPERLRAEVDLTEERISAAGPDKRDAMEHLARLHAWMNREYEDTVSPGSVQYVKGVNLGHRGTRTITKRVGRPPEVVRRSRAEVDALEAERDQERADADAPLGTKDAKTGEYKITPADVTAAFATDPGKASARWLELDEAERESLLRGETLTGVTPRKTDSQGGN